MNDNNKFRSLLLKYYNNKCPITDELNINKLKDFHIISYKNINKIISLKIYNNTFNGMIMNNNLYETEFLTFKFTFDYKNYTVINNMFVNIGILVQPNECLHLEINKYKNKKIKIPYKTLYFIRHHYLCFLEKHNLLINESFDMNINNIINGNLIDNCGDIIMLIN